MKKGFTIAIIVLCIIGAVLSGISLRSHYGTSKTEFCDLDETFDCDLVNRSSFSRFLGVPVALIGLLGYVFLFAVSIIRGRTFAILRLLASFAGLAFAIYLAYIEARVLAVWCLLCIGSLVAIASIHLLSIVAVSRRRAPAIAIGG
jgi:vitamin-K-epoxide reductase (warfarin-sensitive)